MSLGSIGSAGLSSISQTALGGARRAEESLARTAQSIASAGSVAPPATGDALPVLPPMALQEGDTPLGDPMGDPVADQVRLITAQRAYEANLMVLRSADEMSATLLDRLG